MVQNFATIAALASKASMTAILKWEFVLERKQSYVLELQKLIQFDSTRPTQKSNNPFA